MLLRRRLLAYRTIRERGAGPSARLPDGVAFQTALRSGRAALGLRLQRLAFRTVRARGGPWMRRTLGSPIPGLTSLTPPSRPTPVPGSGLGATRLIHDPPRARPCSDGRGRRVVRAGLRAQLASSTTQIVPGPDLVRTRGVSFARHFGRELAHPQPTSCVGLIWFASAACRSRGTSCASCAAFVKMTGRVKLLLDVFDATRCSGV